MKAARAIGARALLSVLLPRIWMPQQQTTCAPSMTRLELDSEEAWVRRASSGHLVVRKSGLARYCDRVVFVADPARTAERAQVVTVGKDRETTNASMDGSDGL